MDQDIEKSGYAALDTWISDQPLNVVLKFAHRVSAWLIPGAEPELRGYSERGRSQVHSAPHFAFAALRVNLLLQVLSHRIEAVAGEELTEDLDAIEYSYISLEDIYDPHIADIIAVPLWGLAGVALEDNAACHFSSDPTAHSTSIFRASGFKEAILRSVQDVLRMRQSLEGRQPEVVRQTWTDLRSEMARAESPEPAALQLPPKLADMWTDVSAHWRSRGSAWNFWVDWYDGLLNGLEPDWRLLEAIARLPNSELRKGAEAVAAEIARIESQVTPQATDSTLAQDINALPAPVGETVAKIKAAMERHREALPPTFDAIEGLILLELDRMKGKNDFGDLGHAEFQRRREVLLLLYEAVKTLRAQLPSSGPISTAQAERSERALRLIFKKLADLPVKKADEIADNLWGVGERIVQAGLIAGTTALATAYGCPMPLALTAGTFVFAPSKAADIIRTTKEALLGSK